jgi:hypothetical protein
MARALSQSPENIARRKTNRKEYLKYQHSKKRIRYRAQLNKMARDMGVYGKRWKAGKDLAHSKNKKTILGLRSAHANRAAGARDATRARKRKH